MRISDCSSDVCSSDLLYARARESKAPEPTVRRPASGAEHGPRTINQISAQRDAFAIIERDRGMSFAIPAHDRIACGRNAGLVAASLTRSGPSTALSVAGQIGRATSELQSLMRTSYAVFCLKKQTINN